MSKRFGRNQRRAMREEISRLNHVVGSQAKNMGRMYSQNDCMRCALETARDVMRKIGWKDDCDAIQTITDALKLQTQKARDAAARASQTDIEDAA